ncbi:hypothetical protein AHiyo6_37510 [Arthrobacter sp. Hiyo6]|nr:hypothetical protein AHiyo6_37510 [Arthrobacter sp. Hiyo6]
MTLFRKSNTMAATAGISIPSPAATYPPVSRNGNGQHKQLRHQRSGPWPAVSAEEEVSHAKSQAEKDKRRARVNTAPQKDNTGAPLTSWNPYQPLRPAEPWPRPPRSRQGD